MIRHDDITIWMMMISNDKDHDEDDSHKEDDDGDLGARKQSDWQ